MEIKYLLKDDNQIVKAVYLRGKLLYTVIYLLDGDGYVDQTVRVYSNSKVIEVQ